MEPQLEVDGAGDNGLRRESNGHCSPDSGVNDLSETDRPAAADAAPAHAPKYVYVKVEAGETFSIRMGETVRQVIGEIFQIILSLALLTLHGVHLTRTGFRHTGLGR